MCIKFLIWCERIRLPRQTGRKQWPLVRCFNWQCKVLKLMGASVTDRLKVGGNSFHITNGKMSSYSTLSCWRFPGNW